MLLFEKLREGLFDDMILIGLCMHAMVRWKSDEQPFLVVSRLLFKQPGTVVSRAIERRHGVDNGFED
jgi:hypothetical protein